MQRHVAFVKAQKSGVRLRTVTLARNDVGGDWYIIVGKGLSFRLFRGCCNSGGVKPLPYS